MFLVLFILLLLISSCITYMFLLLFLNMTLWLEFFLFRVCCVLLAVWMFVFVLFPFLPSMWTDQCLCRSQYAEVCSFILERGGRTFLQNVDNHSETTQRHNPEEHNNLHRSGNFKSQAFYAHSTCSPWPGPSATLPSLPHLHKTLSQTIKTE